MRRTTDYLAFGMVAALAGCSVSAGEPSNRIDEPGELRIRIDEAALRSFRQPERQVHVSGTAKVAVSPDVADISIGVSTGRPTALEAVRVNNAAMTSLIEAVKKRGIAPQDMQTSRVSIQPQYSNPGQPQPGALPELTVPRVVGYEVSNNVSITTKDLARIGDREAVVAGLREKAFDDAKAKAEVYAKRAGLTLGPVAQIAESEAGWMPSQNAPGLMAAPMAPGSPMPVNPGEEEVSLSVQVSFELIPRN